MNFIKLTLIMVYILLAIVLLLSAYTYKLERRVERLKRKNDQEHANRTPKQSIKKENIHNDNNEPIINSKVRIANQIKRNANDVALETRMTFVQAVKSLGMRKPKRFDDFDDRGREQYIKECRKNQLNIDSHPNICKMLPVLNLKGFHIELVKNGMDKINFSEQEELVSYKWHQKWDKIIFDSEISSSEFCNCLREIMNNHCFTETDNNPGNLSNAAIEESESFFIWRALYTMRYHIKLHKPSNEYTKFKISNSQMLIKRNYDEMSDLWNDNSTPNKSPLEELIELTEKQSYLTDSKITLEKGIYGLIYKDDILTEHNRFSYNDNGYHFIYPRYIIFTDTAPFYGTIWEGNTSSYDKYILTEGILGINIQETEEILIQYLFVVLKLVFSMLNKHVESNKTELYLTSDIIKKLELVYPCRLRQYSMLKELNNEHLAEADNILDYLMGKEQWDIISNVESMVDTIVKSHADIKDTLTTIGSSIYYGGSYSYGSTYVKGHYRKNGSYVTGHYRRK